MSDWADVQFGAVRSQDAIDALRKKVAVPTKRWDDFLQLPRSKAHTVAGATKIDLLNDLQQALVDAKAQGQSLGQFRDNFHGIAEKHGWQYNGSPAWRTQLIYDTNMRTASMDARWKQMQENKGVMPYGIYHVRDHGKNRRPDHQAYDGLVLPLDDPWWLVHKPVKAFGCKCTMSAANDRTLTRKGLTVAKEAPPTKYTNRVNSRTGEDYGDWPEGVDVGFTAEDGWLGSDIAFGEKLMQLPQPVRKAVLNNDTGMHQAFVSDSFAVWSKDVLAADKGRGMVHTVGWLSEPIVEALAVQNVVPTTATITLTDHRLRRMVRDLKAAKGIKLPDDVLINLPAYLADYQAVLLDQKGGLVFVLKQPTGKSAGKVAININFKERGEVTNSVRSGGVVQANNLLNKTMYTPLVGKL